MLTGNTFFPFLLIDGFIIDILFHQYHSPLSLNYTAEVHVIKVFFELYHLYVS